MELFQLKKLKKEKVTLTKEKDATDKAKTEAEVKLMDTQKIKVEVG